MKSKLSTKRNCLFLLENFTVSENPCLLGVATDFRLKEDEVRNCIRKLRGVESRFVITNTVFYAQNNDEILKTVLLKEDGKRDRKSEMALLSSID